jgi:glycosyltransferase involved in cell wall biosynthesis
MAQGILHLLDHPEQREALGRAGHQRLHTQLSWPQSVEQLLAAYSSINPSL